jgi:hypothetical protein
MKNVVIHNPIWQHPQALGVAMKHFGYDGKIILSCDYKTSDGEKWLKGKWEVSQDWACQFPIIQCGPYEGYRIEIDRLKGLPVYKKKT